MLIKILNASDVIFVLLCNVGIHGRLWLYSSTHFAVHRYTLNGDSLPTFVFHICPFCVFFPFVHVFHTLNFWPTSVYFRNNPLSSMKLHDL